MVVVMQGDRVGRQSGDGLVLIGCCIQIERHLLKRPPVSDTWRYLIERNPSKGYRLLLCC